MGPRLESDAIRDAVQPAADRLEAGQGRGLADQHQKGSLKGIFGLMCIAKNPPAYAQNHRTMPFDEQGDGPFVAPGQKLL